MKISIVLFVVLCATSAFGIDIIGLLTFECNKLNPMRQWFYEMDVTVNKASVHHYVGGRFETHPLVDAARLIRQHPSFNPAARTVVYCHGFNANPKSDINTQMASYLTARGYNYIAFDATQFFGGVDYVYIAGTVPYVARFAHRLLSELYAAGVPHGNFHLVGESLGAQVMSQAARRFVATWGRRFPRLTGLDPAAPCFATDTVWPSDADYVDVIFSSFLSATSQRLGHAQYYPNNRHGAQPGCAATPLPDVLCSHMRAKVLFAESALNGASFPAKKCSDVDKLVCDALDTSLAGVDSGAASRGDFFFRTNDKSPYGMGQAGLV